MLQQGRSCRSTLAILRVTIGLPLTRHWQMSAKEHIYLPVLFLSVSICKDLAQQCVVACRTNASHTEKKLFPLNSEQTASIQSGGLIAAVHSSPSTAAAVNDDSNSQAKAGNL